MGKLAKVQATPRPRIPTIIERLLTTIRTHAAAKARAQLPRRYAPAWIVLFIRCQLMAIFFQSRLSLELKYALCNHAAVVADIEA